MNITIIGASASVGFESVKRALERNHQVTTLSISVVLLPSDQRLTTLEGSATNREDVKAYLSKADAVIATLEPGKNSKSRTVYADFAKILVGLQKETSVQIPLIILSSFGAVQVLLTVHGK